MCIDYRAIVDFVLSHPEGVRQVSVECLADNIVDSFNVELTAADIRTLGRVLGKLKAKWADASRNKKRFLSNNQGWVELTFCLSEAVCRPSSADGTKNKGRRSLPFPEMSHRSKLRATEDLRQDTSSRALLFAAVSNLRKDGRRTSAQLVQAAASPNRGPVQGRIRVRSGHSEKTVKSLRF